MPRGQCSRCLAGLVAGALVAGAAACGGSAPPSTFLDDDGLELVGALAAAGIAVFAEPGDTQPLREVAAPASPVRLVAWQVDGFVRDAASQAGVAAGELDAIAATEPGEPTASQMVLAWALGTDTPAAALARRQLEAYTDLPDRRLWEMSTDKLVALDAELTADPGDDPVPPVLPELALVLFMSDLATAAEQYALAVDGNGNGGDPGGDNPFTPLGAVAALGAPAAPAPAIGARPCSAVLDVVNSTIARVFAALPRLPEVTELEVTILGIPIPKIITDVVRGIANGAVAVWNGAIDGLRVVIDGVVLTVTKAVLEPIARVAAVIGTLAQIATIVRPWGFSIVANPPTNRKAVSPESPIPGDVTARVELGRFDEWPSAVADCAQRAGVTLPKLRPVGQPVDWFVLETPPGITSHVDPFDSRVLDSNGSDRLGYTTGVEDAETANGDPTVGYLIAAASVQRHDTDRILDAVQRALSAEFGTIVDRLAPLVRAQVQPWLDQLTAQLGSYAGVTGSVSVPIVYHIPKEDDPPRPRPRPRPPGPTPTPTPNPRPNGCGNRCGASIGDPHLITVDGVEYEFQGAGEFVLLRSDVVEIQVRYEPIGDDSAVSVHTAVAAGFDGHRVTIDAGGVSIDGVRDDELSGDRQLDGGSVAWQPFAGTAVRFPDGTTMRVVGASIWIEASEALFADGVGLLAAGAGPSGLPALPDGTQLPEPVSADDVYEQRYVEFGPAWLVGARSLFDYAPGTTTESYFIPDYPDRDHALLELGDLDAALRVLAEHQCAQVSDPALYERCVFDAALTGGDEFVITYVDAESMLDDGAFGTLEPDPDDITVDTRPASTVPVAAGREGEPALVLDGPIDQFGTTLTGALDAAAGTVLLMRTDACTHTGVGVEVTVTSRTDAAAASPFTVLCNPDPILTGLADDDDEIVATEGYLWLPTGGTYDLDVEVFTTDTLAEPIDARVEFYVDPTPTVVEIAGDDLTTLSGEYRLEGIGDTVVALVTHPADSIAFPSPTGLDTACAYEAWGGSEQVGSGDPWPLHFCAHSTEVMIGVTGPIVVPVVMWNRTGEPVDISLGPPA